MEIFDFRVVNTVSGDPQMRSIITRYNNGHEFAAQPGINSTIEMVTLELAFAAHQTSEHNRFEAFAKRHGSFKSFSWRPPGDVTRNWKIVTRSRRQKRSGRGFAHEHTLKLREVFGLPTAVIAPPPTAGSSGFVSVISTETGSGIVAIETFDSGIISITDD